MTSISQRTDYIHIFGPAYIPYQIHPAPHMLSGALKAAGYSTNIIYANIEAQDFLASKSWEGRRALRWMRKEQKRIGQFKSFVKAKEKLRSVLLEQSLTRGERFDYQHNYISYKPKYTTRTMTGLVQTAQDPLSNIFNEYIEKRLMPRLIREQPRLIGLSITDNNQAAFAMALSGLIKDKYRDQLPETKIAIGGYLPSVNKENFILNQDSDPAVSKLFDYVDFVVHNEADNAIVPLMEACKHKRPLDEVPKLIYKNDKGRIVGNSLDAQGRLMADKIDNMPQKGALYFDYPPEIAKQLHLPKNAKEISLVVNLGCAKMCAFCGTDKNYDAQALWIDNLKRKADGQQIGENSKLLRSYKMDEALNLIAQYAKTHKIKTVSFSDERIGPEQLLEIARGLKSRGVKVNWSAYSCVEMDFLKDSFNQELYEGGLRFLQFGVEDLSKKTLKAVHKSQNIKTLPYQRQIFASLNKAGIQSHVFLMIRLPEQRNVDLVATMAYMSSISPNTLTFKPTVYQLTKSSQDAIQPSKEGLRVVPGKQRSFNANLPYKTDARRISESEAKAWQAVLDGWIFSKHQANRVTRHLGTAQRLSVGMERIRRWTYELEHGSDGVFRSSNHHAFCKRFDHQSEAEQIELAKHLHRVIRACLIEALDESKTPELGISQASLLKKESAEARQEHRVEKLLAKLGEKEKRGLLDSLAGMDMAKKNRILEAMESLVNANRLENPMSSLEHHFSSERLTIVMELLECARHLEVTNQIIHDVIETRIPNKAMREKLMERSRQYGFNWRVGSTLEERLENTLSVMDRCGQKLLEHQTEDKPVELVWEQAPPAPRWKRAVRWATIAAGTITAAIGLVKVSQYTEEQIRSTAARERPILEYIEKTDPVRIRMHREGLGSDIPISQLNDREVLSLMEKVSIDTIDYIEFQSRSQARPFGFFTRYHQDWQNRIEHQPGFEKQIECQNQVRQRLIDLVEGAVKADPFNYQPVLDFVGKGTPLSGFNDKQLWDAFALATLAPGFYINEFAMGTPPKEYFPWESLQSDFRSFRSDWQETKMKEQQEWESVKKSEAGSTGLDSSKQPFYQQLPEFKNSAREMKKNAKDSAGIQVQPKQIQKTMKANRSR